MEPIGLYQLNSLVKKVFRDRFPDTFLLVAEIADIKENRSGHCYLELVEKRESDDAVIASARATIWAYTYRMLKPYFETTTGKRLQRGIKVLVSVEVVFHELYGYSLNVKNIDPTFTIGDLERRRKEILARLEQEGIAATVGKRNFGDSYVTHGAVSKLYEATGMDCAGLLAGIREVLDHEA